VGIERWWNDDGRITFEHSDMTVLTYTVSKNKNQRDLACD